MYASAFYNRHEIFKPTLQNWIVICE
uniref:Uncharacterized protein n=1 Tax=Rhizophora mucronata TaxID=61149 RepID=A0A2P2NA34_RHIMU